MRPMPAKAKSTRKKSVAGQLPDYAASTSAVATPNLLSMLVVAIVVVAVLLGLALRSPLIDQIGGPNWEAGIRMTHMERRELGKRIKSLRNFG
jgi:hypothetical protein